MVPTVRGACPQSPAVPDPLHLSSTNCEAVSHAEAPPRPGGRDLGLPKRPLDSCGVRKLSASSFQLSAKVKKLLAVGHWLLALLSRLRRYTRRVWPFSSSRGTPL